MRYLLILLLLLLPLILRAQQPADAEIQATLAAVNADRAAAGLAPVKLSEKMSAACTAHARYLVVNNGKPGTGGMDAHNELADLPGYTKEGAVAASRSVISFSSKPSEAINSWMSELYHRIPLLQPNLKEIGIGTYGENGYNVSLIDCIGGASGANSVPVVFFPGADQANVPLRLGNEIPDPVPHTDGNIGPYGYPITVYFCNYQKVTNVTFELRNDAKKVVPCYVSTPEKPATSFTQWNTVCAIPCKALEPGRRYHVSIKCRLDGKPFSKEYSFSTLK